jgi:hypothetical protein
MQSNAAGIDSSWEHGFGCTWGMESSVPVTNVKLMKSILLSKEKLCLYIHESLEHHGSPWKLTIANPSGGE